MKFHRIAALTFLTFTATILAKVQVYDPPSLFNRSSVFSLKAGGNKVTVLSLPEYDYAHFSAGPAVDIEVTAIGPKLISNFTITPLHLEVGKEAKVTRNRLSWCLGEDNYMIVKIDNLPELIIAVDPLENDAPPSHGQGIYNVLDKKYAADKSGKTLSTAAFERAFADASEAQIGPRIVYVPPGVYTVGNIILLSNTSLYIAGGAVLRFSGNPHDYSDDWFKDGAGRQGTYWISTAHNSTNIKVYGRGTLDANGYSYVKKKFACVILVPVMTTNFTFDGLVLRESPSTAFTLVRSSDVNIQHMKVFNRLLDMDDNGSVDLVESHNVIVQKSIGVSLSDSFTTKASKPAGPKVPAWPGPLQPASDITFKDCVAWTANYGFKVGQGAMQNQSNIHFIGGTVYDAAVAMGIHKKWGPGSAINVTFENMLVEKTTYTTSFLNGIVGSWLALFVEDGGSGVGPIIGVRLSNIRVLGQGGSPPLIEGLEGAPISDVTFQNVRLSNSSKPVTSLKELGLTTLDHAYDVAVTKPVWKYFTGQRPCQG